MQPRGAGGVGLQEREERERERGNHGAKWEGFHGIVQKYMTKRGGLHGGLEGLRRTLMVRDKPLLSPRNAQISSPPNFSTFQNKGTQLFQKAPSLSQSSAKPLKASPLPQ